MKKRKLRRIGTGLLSCLLFSATILSGRIPAFAEPLRIAYTATALVFGPLWVTQDAGLFKKYNLDVDKLLYIAGGTPSTQALIAGEVEVAFTAAGAVVAANLAGADVVLIGATIDTLPFEVWAVPSIKDPSQLKGTKMGVSRLGATSDFVARYVVKKWGLKPDGDVAIFQTGGMPEVFGALKGGSIQSGVMDTGPFTLLAEKEGFVRLADISTMGLAYAFGPFAARQSFLRSRSDLASRFMKAYVEGIHRFKTDKRLALAAIEKYTKVKMTPATEQVYEIYASRYIKRVPEATAEGLQTILDEVATSRPLPSGIAPQRFADSRFTKEIIDSGFADALYRSR
jgi:ABC-type nitrate/sulfonate/bicarbonate transport system substrate-binding protein